MGKNQEKKTLKKLWEMKKWRKYFKLKLNNFVIFLLIFKIFCQIGLKNQFLYNAWFTNRGGLELCCCFLNGANSGMKSTLIWKHKHVWQYRRSRGKYRIGLWQNYFKRWRSSQSHLFGWFCSWKIKVSYFSNSVHFQFRPTFKNPFQHFRLVDRYLIDGFSPQRLSTYALNLFRHRTTLNEEKILIGNVKLKVMNYFEKLDWISDFWDTAGQEKFQSMHPSYYHQAHACILVFDATRKNTYKNLANWYAEMRKYRPSIPCISAVNKIDGN